MEYFTGDFDTDCMILYQYIDELPLFPTNNRKKYNNDIKPISNVYGTTQFENNNGLKRPKDEGGGYKTKLKEYYPEYQKIFEEFMDEYTNFSFNQVVINKNFKILPHKDAKNVGQSYIIGLGDYKGGELVIDYETYQETKNINHQFYTFDGSKYKHWVKDFKGDRITLVFYNINY